MLSSDTFLFVELLGPFLVLVLFCYLYVKNSAVNVLTLKEKGLKPRKNILLVIAHPDDECMFFAPTIISLLNAGHSLFLVCLSKGNFYGLGDKRKKELVASCAAFGIPARNVSIVDDERFQDGLDTVWNPEPLGEAILSVQQRVGADAVVTFDKFGVSSHPNHIALYTAVEKLHSTGALKDVTVFVLKTTNLFRKYVSFLDIPFSSIVSMTSFVCSPREVRTAWKAMACHKTQLVWFRKLFVVFSRYIYVNTLKEIR